jgi:DNA uptake protein ComE-like DNA-binding protein
MSFAAKLLITAILCFAVLWMTACDNHPSDQQIQQQAAHDAAVAKKNAEKAASDARVAAADAERRLNDVTQGVKQGLRNGNSSASGPVNVNAAGRDQLLSLPGITDARAQRIIDRRPYSSPHDMVHKGAISEAEYQRISGQVVTE